MTIKKIYFLSFLLFLTFGWLVSHAQESYSQSQCSITFDIPTGNYIIRYPSKKSGTINVKFELPTKVLPKIKPRVIFNPSTDRFVYTYSVSNQSNAQQPIMSVEIEAGMATQRLPLLEHADLKGWFFMKATGVDPMHVWMAYPRTVMLPGNSVNGFSLTSQGLPGILHSRFTGYSSLDSLAFPDEPPEEVNILIQKIVAKPENRYVEVKTVGGAVLPNKLTNEQLLDRMVQLTQEALSLGWIDDPAIAKALEEKLIGAKEKVQAGQLKIVGNILHAFIHDLQAQHREGEEVTQENKDKHINDNAFYLLKPNAEFILWKLSVK